MKAVLFPTRQHGLVAAMQFFLLHPELGEYQAAIGDMQPSGTGAGGRSPTSGPLQIAFVSVDGCGAGEESGLPVEADNVDG